MKQGRSGLRATAAARQQGLPATNGRELGLSPAGVDLQINGGPWAWPSRSSSPNELPPLLTLLELLWK